MATRAGAASRSPVPGRPGDADDRARALRRGRRPADRQPARPHRSRAGSRPTRIGPTRPSLLLAPDHYLYRMLYSQGIDLDALGDPVARRARPRPIRARRGGCSPSHYHLFRGTPSRLWLDHVFAEVFGIDVALEAATADHYFDAIGDGAGDRRLPPARAVRPLPHRLPRHHRGRARRPRRITTRSARSGWSGRVVTTYRPDGVIDVEHEQFARRDGALRRADRRGRLQLARLPRRAPQAPRRLPRARAPPRPTTATRPPRPPTCRRRSRGAVRARSSAATGPPPTPSCSARRC